MTTDKQRVVVRTPEGVKVHYHITLISIQYWQCHCHIPISVLLIGDLTWWESHRCCTGHTRGRKEPSETSLHSCSSPLDPLFFLFLSSQRRTIKEIFRDFTQCFWMFSLNRRNASVTDQSYQQGHTNFGGTITAGVSTNCTTGGGSPGETGASWCTTPPAIDRVCHHQPILPPTSLVYNASFVTVLPLFVSTK